MHWLANENVPSASVLRLQASGEVVAYVVEDARAIADTEVLEWARREQRIILTFDRDYGELNYRRRLPVPSGVVYFRLPPVDPGDAGSRVLEWIAAGYTLEGLYTVVDQRQVRQRQLS
jgi:predicted nuclease of predicted toxin-antitoxin system